MRRVNNPRHAAHNRPPLRAGLPRAAIASSLFTSALKATVHSSIEEAAKSRGADGITSAVPA